MSKTFIPMSEQAERYVIRLEAERDALKARFGAAIAEVEKP